jgi:hypothetical protein
MSHQPPGYPTKAERDAALQALKQIRDHGEKILINSMHSQRARNLLVTLSTCIEVLRRDPDMYFKAVMVEIEGEP